jgi:hypothetical protein
MTESRGNDGILTEKRKASRRCEIRRAEISDGMQFTRPSKADAQEE